MKNVKAGEPPFDPGITRRYEGATGRILNRDGSFNVRRRGGKLRDFHLYRLLIDLSWPAFIVVIVVAFIAVNVAFTGLYLAAGADLQGLRREGPVALDVFFFSVQTLTTVGYGVISPRGTAANAIACLEALLGVLGFAFSAGLLYGRFARPVPRILFSARAVVAPYRGGTSLQLRLANLRKSVIVDLDATVVLMQVARAGADPHRTYTRLELERSSIFFLPLTWTIVHPIDAASPLAGQTPRDLQERATEIFVLIRGFDDTFNQVVNARCSYRFDEILWGHRYRRAFRQEEADRLTLDLARIDDTEPAPLP